MSEELFMRFRKCSGLIAVAAAVAWAALPAVAQFGGRPGDTVIYMVTAKGSGDFQVVSPGTTNDAASVAKFKVTDVTKVPFVGSDPFPLARRVLYEEADEIFQVGTDFETTVGLHRLFLTPVKILVIEGVNSPFGTALGQQNNFITFPKGLDVQDDVALETISVATWAPTKWPFMVVTDSPGPLRPPEMKNGFEYLFQVPGLVKLPFFLPWTPMRSIYPGVGWKAGIDMKLLDQDQALGCTIRTLRLRPGKQTPTFRIPGSTHIYVLQGRVILQQGIATPLALESKYYAYLPKGFAVRLSNPKTYDGPNAN